MSEHEMRPLDEFVCLWNDTRARMPRSAWSCPAWSWPIAAAAGAAMLTLIGTSSTVVPTEAKSSTLETPPASASGCEEQIWPYLSEACLRRSSSDARPVRVLHYDQAMANAAIGATPWASKHMSPSERDQDRTKQARGKHTGHEQAIREDRSRSARSDRRGRRGPPERMFSIPRGAYQAYGYAPY
jgi:hypothetical protein